MGNAKYTKMAISIHWIMVILVTVMFVVGWYMVDLPPGPSRSFFFSLHKSLGLVVFLLVVFRAYWRITNRPPELPVEIGEFRRQIALIVHKLFYVLLILQPVTGYISTSFSGYKTSFFGIPLPYWGWRDPSLNELFTQLHIICSVVLFLTMGFHILGTILHWIEGRSYIFRRMWFW